MPPRRYTGPTTAKTFILDTIQKLPDESTFVDIRERIQFIAGVREGLDAIARGDVVPLDEVEKEIDVWASRPSR